MNVQPHVVRAAEQALPRVEAHPHPDLGARGPLGLGQRALGRQGRGDRGDGTGEHGEHGVPL